MMATWVVIVLVAMTFAFILADTIKDRRAKAALPKAAAESRVDTERRIRIEAVEADVEEKLKEIQSHRTTPPVPPAAGPSGTNGSDPMNDTRCMRAVKEKADEIERIAKKRGLSV